MRTLLEIVVAGLLIAIGWDKSFKDRASEFPWLGDKIVPAAKAPVHPQSSTVHPRPSPSASGSWMWDPNRKSPLDPPAKAHSTPTPH